MSLMSSNFVNDYYDKWINTPTIIDTSIKTRTRRVSPGNPNGFNSGIFGYVNGQQTSTGTYQQPLPYLSVQAGDSEFKNFKELFDNVFETSEKEQFLIDLGYRFEKWEAGKILSDPVKQMSIFRSDATPVLKTLDDLFLEEIIRKFKKLLLSKMSIKINL